MRYIRSAILAAILTVALVVPATAGAQISSISLTFGSIQARGALVPMQVSFQCDAAFNFAFVNTSLTEVVGGHRVATGFGSFFTVFPGSPCPGPGVAITVSTPILASGPFAFKPGSAIAFADVTVFDPISGNLIDQTVTQTVKLPK
jgi:hypothetical protein